MIKFKTMWLPIPVPEKALKLLGMLLVNLRYRQVQRGEQQINTPKLIGGIVAWYVLKRSGEIEREFAEIESQSLSATPLPGFYTPEQLADIRAASADQIPDVLRVGPRRQRKPKSKRKT